RSSARVTLAAAPPPAASIPRSRTLGARPRRPTPPRPPAAPPGRLPAHIPGQPTTAAMGTTSPQMTKALHRANGGFSRFSWPQHDRLVERPCWLDPDRHRTRVRGILSHGNDHIHAD